MVRHKNKNLYKYVKMCMCEQSVINVPVKIKQKSQVNAKKIGIEKYLIAKIFTFNTKDIKKKYYFIRARKIHFYVEHMLKKSDVYQNKFILGEVCLMCGDSGGGVGSRGCFFFQTIPQLAYIFLICAIQNYHKIHEN